MEHIELTDPQRRYLRGLILENLLSNQLRVRASTEPAESSSVATMHADIIEAAILLTKITEPKSEA